MNAIEINGLTKTYKNSEFRLNNISMNIPSGCITGFVGENGSGKTTTIGCILNTLVKDSGTVKVLGHEMTDDSTDIRNDIGVVYDSNVFPTYLTPAKISSAMRHIFSKWDHALFCEHLKKFKLPEKQRIKGFSRGMMMKLGIAVAISHSPKLLILDEATSGLDPIVRDDILDVFLDFIQDENNSVFLSSHISSDLEKVADYIAFIHDGNIIFNESKDDLLNNYGVMRCRAAQFEQIDKKDLVAFRRHDYKVDVLVTDKQSAVKKYPDIVMDSISIEEIMLMHVKGEQYQ